MRSGRGTEVADLAAVAGLPLPDVERPSRRVHAPLAGALPVGLIGIFVGCLLSWRAALTTGVFDDAFWHRATGVWMLDHHQVLTRDIYSFTVPGRSWITPEWGYGVVLAEGVRLVGPVAFWLLSAGVATLAVLCVAWRVRLSGAGWLWTGLLSLETGAAIALFLDDRPQVVSYFFVALLLLLLTLARRRRKVLWAVPVLFAVWANMHGSFLLGLIVLALEAAAATGALRALRIGRVAVVDPLPLRPAVFALVGAGVATFVNPFGPRVYESAIGVTFNSTVRKFIAEWQSPDFHDPKTLGVVVLPAVITVATLALSDRPMSGVDLVLAGFLLVSTLGAARFIPYFAIAWCGLAAPSSPVRQEQLRPTLLTWPIAGVLGLGMLHGPWVPAGQPASSVPVAAVSYLEHHPGRVFSTYLWNDYLDWKGIPVFIDGRTELYTGTKVFGQYIAMNSLSTVPDRILDSYGVQYVLWPPSSALSIYLARDPAWKLVRRSRVSLVFHRVAAPAGATTGTGR